MLQTDDVADLPGQSLEAFLAAGEGDEAQGGIFRMGPFLVGPDGFVQPASLQVSPRFTVRWRKLTVHATIEAVAMTEGAKSVVAKGVGRMHLEVVTGRVPSTASSIGTDRREQTFALLQTLPGKLPRDWRLHLLPDHHFGFGKACPLPMPTSAAAMLGAVTSFLLDLDPYLDALAAAGFGFAEAAALAGGNGGTAKT